MRGKINNFFEKIQRYMFLQALRRSLISLIPLLMIGSFAVLFTTLPIGGYIEFISTWNNGILYKLATGIQSVTVGLISVYMAGTIGYHVGILHDKSVGEKKYGTVLVAVGSFVVLSGAVDGDSAAFGPKGMFLAIVAAGIAIVPYIFVARRMKSKLILADGADVSLRSAIQTILPALCSFFTVIILNEIILGISHAENVYELLISGMEYFSGKIGTGFTAGLIYVVLNSGFWYLGVHGSDVLESISEAIFQVTSQQNQLLIEMGQEPTAILTKPFLDSYVLMGGCGASICLLIALLLFSKRKGMRNLMKISCVPMIFNINEIMVFGLPIIYNPVFLIPFIFVPVVSLVIAYTAMSMGWVPVASGDVQWTTPLLFNSYLATGSFRGVVLQIVVVAVGVAIYAPFVKLYDKRKAESAKADYELMLQKLKESEASRTAIELTDSTLSFGWMGKALAADLEYAFTHGELKLFYQPQYNDEDKCIGVEALLRWNHPNYGWIYPPLIIKLAEETGMREKLEKWIISSVIEDAEMLQKKYPDEQIKISVNVTGTAIQQKSFEDFLAETASKKDVGALHICIEITEQDALLLDETLRERFLRLKKMGYMFAVDDFSMGSTSIGYLTGSHFELVKLDGSLVRGVVDNPRCSEIIASIIHLSDSLDVQVIAEFVSDALIREKLLKVGCRMYQGWYYSPAIPLEEFEKILQKKNENS